MARIPMVTRTIQTTKANVLCLNIKNGTPFYKEVILPRTYKDEKSMMKVVEKVVNDDEVKAVHIVDTVVRETLYGMTEQEFVACAEVMPPRPPAREAVASNTDTATCDPDSNPDTTNI